MNKFRVTKQTLLILVLMFATALPASAQLFFSFVFDPTNYANAVLRYEQLQQQFTQLVMTYQQITAQYQLMTRQAQQLPRDLVGRYHTLSKPWQLFKAEHTYDTTTPWIESANTGEDTLSAYAKATQKLLEYGSLSDLPSDQASRTRTHYDRLQLPDAAIVHSLSAVGSLRNQEPSVEDSLRNLEEDAFDRDSSMNTQVGVLNKINAANVTSARLAKDTNKLLVSLLEQQLLDATDRREAAVQAVDAHIAFLSDAPPLFAQTTAQTTEALTTFRIP